MLNMCIFTTDGLDNGDYSTHLQHKGIKMSNIESEHVGIQLNKLFHCCLQDIHSKSTMQHFAR